MVAAANGGFARMYAEGVGTVKVYLMVDYIITTVRMRVAAPLYGS